MSEKLNFVAAGMTLKDALVTLQEKVPEYYGAYFDNGFNSGGADEIVDNDISANYGFTAAEFGSFITLLEQVNNLLTNQSVSQNDYNSTLNKTKFGVK